ncbi:hypothetical protein KR074_003918, partial [Drosophila pseudoananassae]
RIMAGSQDYDRQYLRSMSGLCKVACLLCSFIGFLCIACGPVRISNFRGSFYLVVVSLGFVATLVLLLARYLRLWERQCRRCDPVIWSLAVHSSLALGYFTASGLVLSLDIGAYTVGAVSKPLAWPRFGSLRSETIRILQFFGLTVFSLNGLEAYANYRRSRQRDVATQTI